VQTTVKADVAKTVHVQGYATPNGAQRKALIVNK
jgi:hypothetical protein